MVLSQRIDPVACHTFDCSLLTGTFQLVAAGGFDVNLSIYKMFNGSSEDVILSYDGINVNDVLPSGGVFIFDVSAQAAGNIFWPAGRQLFVKGVASVGTLYEIGYTMKRIS